MVKEKKEQSELEEKEEKRLFETGEAVVEHRWLRATTAASTLSTSSSSSSSSFLHWLYLKPTTHWPLEPQQWLYMCIEQG